MAKDYGVIKSVEYAYIQEIVQPMWRLVEEGVWALDVKILFELFDAQKNRIDLVWESFFKLYNQLPTSVDRINLFQVELPIFIQSIKDKYSGYNDNE
jgi:hypothetical protein